MTACTLHKSQKASSSLSRLINMNMLLRREEFLRICSKEELVEKAQDIEMTIPVKKSQETRYNLDPGSFFVNCFLSRRPDGVTIHEALKIVYIYEGFLEVKDAEANEQYKSIIGALKVAAPEWEFEQIIFAVGNHGSVVESNSTPSSKSLIYKKGKKTSSSLIM